MNVIFRSFPIMSPLLLAALGGLFSDFSGTLNIALEGMMALGAFETMAFSWALDSAFWGVLLGVLANLAWAFVLGLLIVKLKADPFISGLAINLASGGVCAVIAGKIFGTEGVVSFPSLPPLPLVWGQDVFLPVSLCALLVCHIVFYHTPYGIRLRACGKNPEALRAAGLDPGFYKFSAFVISAVFCSLAGACVMLELGAYVPNATSGKGWTALVVIFLGAEKPWGLLAASFVFALADSFSNFAQGFWNIPSDFILAVPYLFTLGAMIVFAILREKKKEFS